MHEVWRLREQVQLGLVAWNSDTEFHSVEIQPAGNESSKTGKDLSTRNETSAQSEKNRRRLQQ